MSQGNFNACLAVTLAYEGGKANNPKDPGGRTNEGVTQTTYNAYLRKKNKPADDVFDMTDAERDDIYQTEYWTPAGCEALAAGLDLCHFDGSVNSGLGESKKWLKISGTDGGAGAITAYSKARLQSLESFKTWATFGRGWSARVAGVEAKALAMVGAAPETVAAAGKSAADSAKVSSTVAHTAAVVAGAGVTAAATTSHPSAGIILAIVSALGAIWNAFHASTSGARAAVLAQAATAP